MSMGKKLIMFKDSSVHLKNVQLHNIPLIQLKVWIKGSFYTKPLSRDFTAPDRACLILSLVLVHAISDPARFPILCKIIYNQLKSRLV